MRWPRICGSPPQYPGQHPDVLRDHRQGRRLTVRLGLMCSNWFHKSHGTSDCPREPKREAMHRTIWGIRGVGFCRAGLATRGRVSTTARSLTSKALHLVRVGGEVRRGLGSSTLEAAVEASLTQDIKSRHLALIRPAPWPRRGLPALVDLMIDKGRCLAPYPGRRHPSSIPSHSESTIPARALAPSDGLALAHAGCDNSRRTKTNGLASAHSALCFLVGMANSVSLGIHPGHPPPNDKLSAPAYREQRIAPQKVAAASRSAAAPRIRRRQEIS